MHLFIAQDEKTNAVQISFHHFTFSETIIYSIQVFYKTKRKEDLSSSISSFQHDLLHLFFCLNLLQMYSETATGYVNKSR